MPTIELRAYGDYDREDLAVILRDMVRRNAGRLAIDFPAVVSNYESFTTAERSIIRAARRAERWAYGYFMVIIEGDEVGVVSYEQANVAVPKRGFERYLPSRTTEVIVEGPNIAIWLDQHRPAVARGVGTETMALLIDKVIADKRTHGRLWTVVRGANERSKQMMDELDQPRFKQQGPLRHWPIGDGVTVPRRLYMANTSLESLRDQP